MNKLLEISALQMYILLLLLLHAAQAELNLHIRILSSQTKRES